MKYLKSIVAVLVLITAATGNAWAEHGHFGSQPGHIRSEPGHFHSRHDHFHNHVFLGIGVGPFLEPWYFYPPPVVYSPPPVYVEPLPGPASSGNYWYYCAESDRYYPYVTECPGGWQQVVPIPPGPR